MAISDYGVDAVLVLSRGYVERAVARAVDANDLCALKGILPLLPSCDGRITIARADEWMFRFDGLSFTQTEDGVQVRIALETTSGQAKVDGREVDVIHLCVPLSFTGEGTTLRVNLDLIGQSFDVDLSALQVGDVKLAFPSENPATAKVLADGSLAVGLVIDVAETGDAFLLAPRGAPPPAFAQLYVQPATVDFARFRSDFDLDLAAANYQPHWAIGIDRWLLDAFVRASPIDTDKLRVRLRITRATDTGLTLAGSGEAYQKDDWWDVSVAARAEIQLVNGNFQVAWTLTKAEAGPFDKDVLDEIKDRGRESGTISFPLPAQIGDPNSPFGALSVSAVAHGDGLLRMYGSGTVGAYAEADAVVGPSVVDFGRSPGGLPARTRDRIYIRNRNSYQGATRLRLHVCPPRITGADADSFAISVSTPPPVVPGGQATWSVEFRGEAGRNHAAEAVFITSDGRQVVPLQALLAPATLELGKRRSAPKQRVRCSVGNKHVRPQKHADFIVSVHNDGPGNAALLSARLVDATGAQFEISWFEAPRYYDTPGLWLRDGEYRFPPHVIPPDRAAVLGVDFELERDGQPGSVKLVIETTEGPRELTLSTTDELEGADTNVIDGPLVASLDLQSFDRICLEIGKMETIGVREQLAGFQDLLEGLPTDCCPPPAQPMCLCANMADLAFAELPPEAVIELVPRGDDGDGEPWTRWVGGTGGPRVLAPYDAEQGAALRISNAKGAFFKGALRRWTASRVGRVLLEHTVTGASWTAQGVAVLAGDRLLHYRMDEKDRIEQVDERTLGWTPSWISGAEGLVAVGGEAGVEMFEARQQRLVETAQSHVGVEAGVMTYLGAVKATRLIGVRNDRISVLKSRRLQLEQDSDRPTSAIRAAVPLRRGALLFADDKVELLRFVKGRPQPVGQTGVTSAHSVMVIGSLVYALDKTGVGSVLRIGGRALEAGAQIRFPASWNDLLPGGAVAFRGRQFVAARADGKGFNVFRFAMGKADPRELTGAFAGKGERGPSLRPPVIRPTIGRKLIGRPLPSKG